MLPPKEMGTIVSVAPPGRYTIAEKILTIEFMGQQKSFTMMQYWPVRQVSSRVRSRDVIRCCCPRTLNVPDVC